METDRISNVQSNIIQEIHPNILNKTLDEKEDKVNPAIKNPTEEPLPTQPTSNGNSVDLFA